MRKKNIKKAQKKKGYKKPEILDVTDFEETAIACFKQSQGSCWTECVGPGNWPTKDVMT